MLYVGLTLALTQALVILIVLVIDSDFFLTLGILPSIALVLA